MNTVSKPALWEAVPVLRASGQPGAPGTQLALVEGCPWGPAVSRVLLVLPRPVCSDSVTADRFQVWEEKEAFDKAEPVPARILAKTRRTVRQAAAVMADGTPTRQDTPYILLTLAVSPAEGCPFCFNPLTQKADWCDPYRLTVTLTAPLPTPEGKPLDCL